MRLNMTKIPAAVFIVVFGCRSNVDGGIVLEEQMIRDSLTSLGQHTGEYGNLPYRRAIAIVAEVCQKTDCIHGGLTGKSSPLTPAEVARFLLLSDRPELGEAGLDVACGLCGEAGKRCLCDGRTCALSDLRPAWVPQDIVCGFVIIDGVSYAWGSELRAANKAWRETH